MLKMNSTVHSHITNELDSQNPSFTFETTQLKQVQYICFSH